MIFFKWCHLLAIKFQFRGFKLPVTLLTVKACIVFFTFLSNDSSSNSIGVISKESTWPFLLSPFVFHLEDLILLQHDCWYTLHLEERWPQFFDFLFLKYQELFVKIHNSLYSLLLLLWLLLMYVSFQLTPPRVSSQAREGLILLLFLFSFYVAGDCVCLYSHQSHIFDYFYMLLRDDCFLSIENRASASFQFPIVDLYLPLWECHIVIFCDRVDRPNILCFSCLFLILTRYIDFLETMDCLRCCHLKFCFFDNEWSSCF